MKTDRTIYSLLDEDARSWWAYRRMREHGQLAEARARERRSILSHVQTIRAALENNGIMTIGHGGYTIHYSPSARLSGYQPDTCGMVAATKRAGLPWCDIRVIPWDRLTEMAIGGPIVTVGLERTEGWGSFDRVTVADYLDWVRDNGAIVGNWPR